LTRYRLQLEWDGRGFMGWQRQAHGPSVQEAVERAVTAVTQEEALVHAAGRTDAGVHALAMTAHVDVMKKLPPFRLMEALNARLVEQGVAVAVLSAEEAPPGFHARFSCTGRHYLYRLVCRRAPLALDAGRAWRLPKPLDLDRMREAAVYLVGRHDFTTFRSVHCQAQSAIKTLDRLEIVGEGEQVMLRASARSFLHHQVRSMTGALVWVGLGRWTPDRLRQALDARDRGALPINAPPDGLYFVQADYGEVSAGLTPAMSIPAVSD
jgi:tRNA pseudouridine38-40 synthase